MNYIGKPSLYLPFCMMIWGTLSILTGITKEWGCFSAKSIYNTPLMNEYNNSFTGALLTRFFLGFVEAAFFPGALFLLSKWYREH